MQACSRTVVDVNKMRDRPVNLDRRGQFLFFGNRKVAQRSINRHELRRRSISYKDNWRRWDRAFEKLRPVLEGRHGTDETGDVGVFAFTVVRNPLTRFMSAFRHLQDRFGLMTDCADVNEFCERVFAVQGTNLHRHFRLQTDGLFHNGTALVDRIVYLENIHEQWPEVADRIGHESRTLRKVRHSGRDNAWEHEMNARSIEIVQRHYANDFELLGYPYVR